MSVSLLPKLIAKELPDLMPELFIDRKISLVMLDFDNTIVPYTTDIPEERMLAWLENMKHSGLQLCVVSNSKRPRVKIFCEKYGLDCITHAKKPFRKGIRQCLNRYKLDAGSAALVGDQIFTDVLGANSSGVLSVLVRAIDNHNFWLKLRHVAELPFIFCARNRKV